MACAVVMVKAQRGIPPNHTPTTAPATPSAQDLAALVAELGDVDWRVRSNASRRLKAAGRAAVPALDQAGRSGNLEVYIRAGEILSVLRPAYAFTVIKTQGLVAYWRFDGASPGHAVVGRYSGGLVNAGVTVAGGGAPIFDEPGNRAVHLSGNQSYVSTDLTSQQQFGDAATFMCWVNFRRTPLQAGRIFSILSKGQAGNDLDLQAEPDGKIHFYTDSGSHTSYAPTSLTGWHHVAASFDAVAQTRRIYWNGRLVADDAYSSTHKPSAMTFTIGECPAFPGRYFEGDIDEVSLFDRSLTPREIAAIYAAASER